VQIATGHLNNLTISIDQQPNGLTERTVRHITAASKGILAADPMRADLLCRTEFGSNGKSWRARRAIELSHPQWRIA
jgi:hypothetical protein